MLVAAGLALPLLSGRARTALTLLAPAAAVALVLAVPDGVAWRGTILGYPVVPYTVDALSRLFALVFAIMAFGGGLFALKQESRVEVPAAFVYAGSAIGVTLAGDLITVFVFWELMALGSTLVIWSAGTASAYRASMRYLMVHLLGGVVLMAGIAGHVAGTGSTAFVRIALDSPAHWLILAGFLVNAGAPPLSAWLPDAYPEASWSGTVFLSAFTTKTAVYVLLRAFPGTELLVFVGLFMIFYGIVYALLENDMRRILAYSIVNQVGFMIVGHRHRDRDVAQRRGRARVHAHPLQGAAADVGRARCSTRPGGASAPTWAACSGRCRSRWSAARSARCRSRRSRSRRDS